MSIFEILMLLCFGAAWPVSIYKSIKSKKTGGKSIIFLFIVFTGYVSGILHKLLFSYDLVIVLYIINSIMVAIDIAIFFNNMKLEKI